ncbi:DUF362 domain-containing protein [Desulforhopalus sp. 52FAK]
MIQFTRRQLIILFAVFWSLLKLPFSANISSADKTVVTKNTNKGLQKLGSAEKPTVVRVWDKKLINGQSTEGNYFKIIDNEKVEHCMERAVCLLTGSDNIYEAWNNLLSSYRIGQKIVLRTNFNPADKSEETFFNDIIVSPQIINSVINSLHSYVKVPYNDIIIYELTRPIPENLIRKYIEFPVIYVEKPSSSFVDKVKNKLRIGLAAPDFNYPIEMRENVVDDNGNQLTCYLPKVLTQADHLINLSVFKYHQFGLLSGLLKNHYGTVRFSNLSHYPVMMHDNKVFKCTVDLNRHPLIQKITRLHIVDSIFGAYDYQPGMKVKKEWKTFDSSKFPQSIYMGQDPVATESVLYSYLLNERDRHDLPTKDPDYLQDAEDYNLGVFEIRRDFDFEKIRYFQIDNSVTS